MNVMGWFADMLQIYRKAALKLITDLGEEVFPELPTLPARAVVLGGGPGAGDMTGVPPRNERRRLNHRHEIRTNWRH